jgi:hypothetical protein
LAYEVHAHLRNGEHRQGRDHRRLVDQVGPGREEGSGGQEDRQAEAELVTRKPSRSVLLDAFFTWGGVAMIENIVSLLFRFAHDDFPRR